MFLRFIVTACQVLLAALVYAQSAPTIKPVALPSPNSASLGKYGEIPVSLYTGIPQISIPLYSIKTKDIEVPISISYHAGGIKVEEIASNVGCGWSLNIGGIITRSIRGLPDSYNHMNTWTYIMDRGKDYTLRLGSPSNTPYDGGNCRNEDDKGLAMDISAGIEDGEPDIYYFNFGNYTGSFFLGESGQFIISPKQGLKIEKKQILAKSADDVAQWTVTTPDGMKYVFGVSQDEQRSALEKNFTGGLRNAFTSWCLTDIISPNGAIIKFTYNELYYTYTTRAGEAMNKQLLTEGVGNVNMLQSVESRLITNQIYEPRISMIEFPEGKVIINSATDRADIPGCTQVNDISVFNYEKLLRPIKKFHFVYDYTLGARLTLKGLEEQTGFSTNGVGSYSFKYYDNSYSPAASLPERIVTLPYINGQDLWGYYNGNNNNTTLPPSYSLFKNGVVTNFTGADRHSDPNKMKAGVLTEIAYPTGGTTKFEYEANSLYSRQSFDGIPDIPDQISANIDYATGQTASTSFVVGEPENGIAMIEVYTHSMEPGCPIHPYSNISVCNNAYIEGTTAQGTPISRIYLPEGNSHVELPPGNYVLAGEGINIAGAPQNIFHVVLSWYEYSNPCLKLCPITEKTVGGLRILRIKNVDPDGTVVSVKKYSYSHFNWAASSGVLVNYPSPFLNFYFMVGYSEVGEPPSALYFRNLWAQIKSTPNVPLSPTGGAVIGYENVTELEGENGENGKTEYTFSTANDARDIFNFYRPFPPPISYEFRRGKMKSKTIYKNTGGNFSVLQTTKYNYTVGINGETGYGLVVDYQNANVRGMASDPYVPLRRDFYLSGSELISDFQFLSQETTRIFSPANPAEYTQIVKEYDYDRDKGNYQLKKTTTVNSKEELLTTELVYPQDIQFPAGTAETARAKMVDKHIWNAVLQEKNYTAGVLTTQTNTNYKEVNSNLLVPDNIETKVGTANPEIRVEFLKYDAQANILRQHKASDLINFVIWDYKNQYPIAEVVNASDTRIDSIAYTSFEADGKGNWIFSGTILGDASSPTGHNCYALGSEIKKTGLSNTTTYIVSYWKKGGSISVTGSSSVLTGRSLRGWTYYEHTVINPSTGEIKLTGSGALIDEVRLYPKNASMTTYTYKPLVGITSQCDPNNHIVYYDYDPFNRLYLVRDQDFNILKRLHYNYGNTENSTLAFNTQQEGIYISNCAGCKLPTAIHYIVPADTYLAPDVLKANQIALEDLATYGQAYADAFAVCTTPGTPAIYGTNSTSAGFTVTFTNRNTNCSPLNYTFVVNSGASMLNLGSIREGNYDVTFSAGTNPNGYTYRVNGLTDFGNGGEILNISIRSSATNQVRITNN